MKNKLNFYWNNYFFNSYRYLKNSLIYSIVLFMIFFIQNFTIFCIDSNFDYIREDTIYFESDVNGSIEDYQLILEDKFKDYNPISVEPYYIASYAISFTEGKNQIYTYFQFNFRTIDSGVSELNLKRKLNITYFDDSKKNGIVIKKVNLNIIKLL